MYFDAAYFDPAFFDTGLLGGGFPSGPLEPDVSPYFDGCYFDPAYFDASVCVTPPSTGGRNYGRLMRRQPEWDELEDLWLLGLSDEYLRTQ